MSRIESFDTDVIVIGLGAWGSSTLWRLAERGVRCVGFERYGNSHALGSSHGYTRLFRVACQEHPGLVAMARRSRDLWKELEAVAGEPMLFETGALSVGEPASDMVAGTVRAGAASNVAVEQLIRDEVRARFPAYVTMGPTEVGAWDPEAGILDPDLGVQAANTAAIKAGAQAFFDTRVTGIELVENGVVVTVGGRVWAARQVIVTAGAWLGKLVPGLPLEALRTPMQWFESKNGPDDPDFALENFPAFMRRVKPGVSIWGHGSALGEPVKIGLGLDDGAFDPTDPDLCDRGINPARDWNVLSEAISTLFPGLNPTPVQSRPCMVTMSPDGQFLIGRPNNDPRLIIGGGCSGHGFKHATGIGELLAQLATNESPYLNAAFVDPNRFDNMSDSIDNLTKEYA